VFDGHGGFAAADYLQHNLYRIFTRVLGEKGAQADLESVENLAGLACPLTFTHVLTDSFKHADEDLLAWMHGEQLDARWY
jgi:serine/threonine protein phosphatase PrpC